MSGQLLFNRVLVEKEKALGRRAVVNTYMGLATSFMLTACGYSTLTYLAAQPALSRNPAQGDTSKTSVSSSSSAVSSLNEPESGVRLLLSIFSRLGPGEKIAMVTDGGNRWTYKPNIWATQPKHYKDAAAAAPADQELSQARPATESQFNQGLSSNAADPALSIHPQVNKRAASDEFSAGNPQPQSYSQAQSQVQPQQAQSQQVRTAMRGKLNQTTWYKAPVQMQIISDSPDIREFTPSSKADTAGENRKAVARRQVNVVDEPLGRARTEHSNLIEQSRDLQASAGGADSVTGIIRPSEQPGLFKYVREYYKDSLKNMPASASMQAGTPVSIPQILDGSPIVSDSKISEENEAAGKSGNLAGFAYGGGGANHGSFGGSSGSKSVTASYDAQKKEYEFGQGISLRVNKKKPGGALQIAFLPPNAVHGINGLSLGASAAETTAFLKSRGTVSKVMISGFQIFTLKGERGKTLLQAFVRDERLEAVRVFSATYVPPQLDVNLGEDLPSMKAKFGEPAFILEEPRVKAKAPPVVAKNYVYPVSQVSFQLSRPSANSTPQVLSMLLFRFL